MFKPKDEKLRIEEIERQIKREQGQVLSKEVLLDTKKDITDSNQDIGENPFSKADPRFKPKSNSTHEERIRQVQRLEKKLKESSDFPQTSTQKHTINELKKRPTNQRPSISQVLPTSSTPSPEISTPPETPAEKTEQSGAFSNLGKRVMTGMSGDEVAQMEQTLKSGRFTMNEYKTQLKAAAKASKLGKAGSKFMSWIPGTEK